jgi:hypothetical protein
MSGAASIKAAKMTTTAVENNLPTSASSVPTMKSSGPTYR